mgnify:CR=1 FL=1
MKESASAKEIESVEELLAEFGFQTHPIQGEKKTVIGAIGDKRLLSMNQILTVDGVEYVVPLRPRVQTFFAAVRSSRVHHHIHSKVLRVMA